MGTYCCEYQNYWSQGGIDKAFQRLLQQGINISRRVSRALTDTEPSPQPLLPLTARAPHLACVAPDMYSSETYDGCQAPPSERTSIWTVTASPSQMLVHAAAGPQLGHSHPFFMDSNMEVWLKSDARWKLQRCREPLPEL